MHLQVAAARTPWAACSSWFSIPEFHARHYSKQDEASAAADSSAGASKQRQNAGSTMGSEDAEQSAGAGQEAVDEGTATIEDLQSLLTKAQEDVGAAACMHWLRIVRELAMHAEEGVHCTVQLGLTAVYESRCVCVCACSTWQYFPLAAITTVTIGCKFQGQMAEKPC